MNRCGTLIVYSGPSGVGKGTLLKPLLQRDPNLVMSVSATTRKPRPGERDGIEYHFIERERFQSMIDGGEFLEYACYNGNFYGTPHHFVQEQLNQGKNVVLEIEVQGAMQIKKNCPSALFVFVMPPSLDELKRRLEARGTESQAERDGRITAASAEIRLAKEYDYILINDDLDRASGELSAIITAAGCRAKHVCAYIDTQFPGV